MTGATQAEREARPVSAGEIRRTYQQIRPYLRRTPTLTVPLAALTGAGHGDAGPDVVLKLEQLQCAGSFKARGAFANLVLREIPPAGVVAASGGNTASPWPTPRTGSACTPPRRTATHRRRHRPRLAA
jgi:threonine dehydratase